MIAMKILTEKIFMGSLRPYLILSTKVVLQLAFHSFGFSVFWMELMWYLEFYPFRKVRERRDLCLVRVLFRIGRGKCQGRAWDQCFSLLQHHQDSPPPPPITLLQLLVLLLLIKRPLDQPSRGTNISSPWSSIYVHFGLWVISIST